jgi:hypothetical protein
MLKGSMRYGMGPGLLRPNGPLSSAENSLTHRSGTNRNPSSAPGSRPLDGVIGKATNGIDSSAGTLQPEGILSMTPIAGAGQTTASRGLVRK